MAAQDSVATGADTAGDVRRRNVNGQPNGGLVPKINDRVDEKTKQKVGFIQKNTDTILSNIVHRFG